MRTVTKVPCSHHNLQCSFDWPTWIRQERRNASKRSIGFGVKYTQNRSNQKRVTSLFPTIAALKRTFRVYQYVRNVLHVAYCRIATANLKQRTVGRTLRIRRIE